MTIGELIARLAVLPSDWPVYVHGYEAGVNDVERLAVGNFERDRNDESYYGQHGDLNEDGLGTPGVELLGKNRLAEAAKAKAEKPVPFTLTLRPADSDELPFQIEGE